MLDGMRVLKAGGLALFLLLGFSAPAFAALTLGIGSGSAAVGNATQLPITITRPGGDGNSVFSTTFAVDFPTATLAASVVAGGSVPTSASVTCGVPAGNRVICVLYTNPATPIAVGSYTIATVTFNVLAGSGTQALVASVLSCSDQNGFEMPAACLAQNGALNIQGAPVPPILNYTPGPGTLINYSGGGFASGIAVIPSGGVGTGSSATSTVGACTITGGGTAFPVTGISQLSFVGATTTAQSLALPNCVPQPSAVNATLTCPESRGGAPAVNRTWTLRCPGLPAISSFAPTSPSVVGGAPITLNWTSSNATSCSPALGGSTAWPAQGVLPTSGSRSVNAPQNAGSITFQLYCSNGAQSVSATTTVNVTPGSAPVINWFYPSLASVVAGTSFNLIWNASNASSCTPALGAGTVWGSLGALPTAGLRTLTAPQAAGPISFELSCTNGAQTVVATAPVTVNANNLPTATLSAASSAVSCETAFRPNVVSVVLASTHAAYCVAGEPEPRRTNWTQISCRPCAQNDPTCGPPVVCPDATDLKKLPPNQTQAVTIFNDQAGPGSGTPTTLQLTCFASVGGAFANSVRPLALVQDNNPGICVPLATATYVPSTATTAPAAMPDGSVTLQASVSNPQGLPLSASVLQQPQFGDVSVLMVGDTVTLRYYPRPSDLPRSTVVTETVQVIIVNGGSGVPVTYTFEVDDGLFSNGFEGVPVSTM